MPACDSVHQTPPWLGCMGQTHLLRLEALLVCFGGHAQSLQQDQGLQQKMAPQGCILQLKSQQSRAAQILHREFLTSFLSTCAK